MGRPRRRPQTAQNERSNAGHFERLVVVYSFTQNLRCAMSNPRHKKVAQSIDPIEIRIRYHFTQLIAEHLTDCFEVFHGDLTEMMVLAILGQAQLGSLLHDVEPVDLDLTLRKRTISASRLSDVSKIPRQTVRRKLLQMEKRGWLVQDEYEEWSLAIKDGRPTVRDALHDLNSRAFERAKRMASLLKPIV
jgi:hypothetical protein